MFTEQINFKLVNTDQLLRNHLVSYHEIIKFLILSELSLRGSNGSVDDLDQAGSGDFLSLYEFTLETFPMTLKIT